MAANNPDLETFRKQWQEEVTARLKGENRIPRDSNVPILSVNGAISTVTALLPPGVVPQEDAEPVDGISPQTYHDLEDKEDARKLGWDGSGGHPSSQTSKEPKSALEHYEKAIEREDQGNLGESLGLYRQAFRVGLCVMLVICVMLNIHSWTLA